MDRRAAPRSPARFSQLSLAVSLAVGAMAFGLSSEQALAVCSAAGSTITCNGAANPLAPSYTNGGSGLTVNVNPGASLGTLLGVGGTSLSLAGNNNTLNNSGTIDPTLLGLLSIQSSAVLIGNTGTGSILNINNNATGVIKGTGALLGANLLNLTGMALDARNGAGGTTTISNAGSIGSSALASLTLVSEDTPVIAVTGGSTVNFTNTGTILGRAAFEASAAGNTFTNAGTLTGSLSMGANSTNRFNAITGSSVGAGLGVGVALLVTSNPNLAYAAAGKIDGGAGGTNTLALQNAIGGGSGTSGSGTINATNYINFSRLIVDAGTWSLIGQVLNGTTQTTLNGGQLNFDNASAFGSGAITVNGGGLAGTVGGLSLANNFILNAGLSVGGATDMALNGVVSGVGGLTKTGAGLLTLGATNTYSGGTTLAAGGLNLTSAAALGSGGLTVSGASSLQGSVPLVLNSNVALNAALTLPGSNALTLGGRAQRHRFAGQER
ncbi:beta strand repeat-containing protein [Pseudomonas mosselii]|uniref:beta strand repeat-containing protein n=1 Tax=Pseudomonas mosselii TaxID=78327 RepID=UPI001E33EF24|nr:autotransporter-associated beta strand repeat-containing protein [Pseudomonas mosselii]WJR29522.1 autotransporter-associated beta strand repeat-containing protein [Pseudomonas mosselii]